MNATCLKTIALCSMLVDHIGTVFFPNIFLFSILGRLAFPIFCFFIAQGFVHTSHIKKYLLKLLGFSFLSEIPFGLALRGKLIDWQAQKRVFHLVPWIVRSVSAGTDPRTIPSFRAGRDHRYRRLGADPSYRLRLVWCDPDCPFLYLSGKSAIAVHFLPFSKYRIPFLEP